MEEDTASKIERLFKSSAVIFVGVVFGSGVALVAETVIARSLSPKVYGSLALAYTICTVVSRLSLFGVKDGVVRLVSEASNNSGKLQIIQHGFGFVLLSGCIFSVALFSIRGPLSVAVDDPKLNQYLPIFIPVILFFLFRAIAYAILRAEGESIFAVISKNILGRILPLAALFIAIALESPVWGGIAYWVSVPLIITTAAIYFISDKYPTRDLVLFRPRISIIKRICRFSIPLAISSYIFVLLSYLDIIMIGYFLDSSQVGYYRAIQPLRRASTLLISAFTFLFLPVATQLYESDNIDGLEKFYTVSTKWLAIGTLPIVIVFSFYPKDIILIFFGDSYLPAAPALSVLTGGLFFRALVGLDGDVVKAIDKTEIELGAAVVGVFTNIILNFILIPRVGIVGAAIGTASGYIVYNMVEVGAIYYIVGVHPFSSNNFKPLIMTISISILIKYITNPIDFALVEIIFIGIGSAVMTILSVWITDSFDENDIMLANRVEDRIDVSLDLRDYI